MDSYGIGKQWGWHTFETSFPTDYDVNHCVLAVVMCFSSCQCESQNYIFGGSEPPGGVLVARVVTTADLTDYSVGMKY